MKSMGFVFVLLFLLGLLVITGIVLWNGIPSDEAAKVKKTP